DNMATHFVSARLCWKFGLRVREQHVDQYGRPVAPTSAARKQHEAAVATHAARWEAVRAARARGLSWSACWPTGAAARDESADAIYRSYCLIQKQRRDQGKPRSE